MLLVLLTPCIDYVIVFTGLAGGASDRLLAAAPVLMLAQMLLLPVYLLVFVGPSLVSAIDPAPFVQALVGLIIVPLALAAVTQWWAQQEGDAPSVGSHAVGLLVRGMQALMVPLMMATLAVVVGSQIAGVGRELGRLLAVVPLYAAFLLVMVPLGMLAARCARLDVPAARAVVFSGAMRNSLGSVAAGPVPSGAACAGCTGGGHSDPCGADWHAGLCPFPTTAPAAGNPDGLS